MCGQVSFPCIPSDWSDPYAHGIAHQVRPRARARGEDVRSPLTPAQYLMGDPRTTLVSGNAACQAQVTDPTTGAQVCASQCVMAAHSYPDYELAVSGDVTSGVSVFHSASAPDATSPFNCPFDPTEGCSGSRRVTYNFLCDRSNKNPAAMTGLVLNETSTCNYLLTAYTYAACATKGDPFRNNQDNGPNNFGFTVLGATLCVVFQFMYSFGDQRGWWEPIKQRIPAIPGLSFLGGGKGGIYGGGGYRSVAAPTGAAAASPYGSTSM